MRIPIIGPNLQTWPAAAPHYISNETFSQPEEVKQRNTADLTEDAAPKNTQQKHGIWLFLIFFFFMQMMYSPQIPSTHFLYLHMSNLFGSISRIILIHVLLHLIIATGRMLVCTVHNCTWARYLPATLLGLAGAQNILRALTFPSSPFPPSSLPFSVC